MKITKKTTLQGTITYPTYGKVKSSDSKVPAGILGYLSSMEDILVESTLHFYDLKGWGNQLHFKHLKLQI